MFFDYASNSISMLYHFFNVCYNSSFRNIRIRFWLNHSKPHLQIVIISFSWDFKPTFDINISRAGSFLHMFHEHIQHKLQGFLVYQRGI